MLDKNKIKALAEERLETLDGYIVVLTISTGNHIKILIDSDHPISISECMSVSRNVEHNLDRETEDFSLEVSSAGLDQPLKHERQYIKNVGRQVKIRLSDNKVVEGLLKKVEKDTLTIETRQKERIEGRKAKIWVETEHVFNLKEIEETKVIISFKK